ncbi:hypothetical protein HanIR_Chr13g0635821 [Helianthus annuus]|nr:hypothetical protein HanIR_Chr13g0635821 [Helianthus annuus]
MLWILINQSVQYSELPTTLYIFVTTVCWKRDLDILYKLCSVLLSNRSQLLNET